MSADLKIRRGSFFRRVSEILPIAFVLAFFIIIPLGVVGDIDRLFVSKKDFHNNLLVAIKNGAHLDDVKQIFENRNHENSAYTYITYLLTGYLGENEGGYYKEPIDLTTVLKDIRSELYLNDSVDSNLVNLMTGMINKHEKMNPFDKLNPGQKIHFELIQTKLGKDYEVVHDSMTRVVDELYNKNKLVDKYFSDATMSYRISIIALIIGFLALIPQANLLWQWWKSRVVGQSNK